MSDVKVIEEEWKLFGRLGQHEEGAVVVRRGEQIIAYVEATDSKVEDRARLAAAAPAMARHLIERMESCASQSDWHVVEKCRACTGDLAVLKDAGVIP